MEIRASLECHECGTAGAAPCAYVDRDWMRCQTAWCAAHYAVGDDGRAYCRRHIRVQAALAPGVPPPKWDNRGAALVLWIIEDVAPHLHALLKTLTTPIQAIALAEVTTDAGETGWEAGWSIVEDGTGSAITIFVADEDQSVVNIRVGSQVLPLGEPPWIHYRGNQIVAELDERLRGKYRETVLNTVQFAMQVANGTMYQAAG